MNIDKIVKECPDAWSEWLEYKYPNFKQVYNGIYKVSIQDSFIWITTTTYQRLYVHLRELFDYFDSVGIEIYPFNDFTTGNGCRIYIRFRNGRLNLVRTLTGKDNRTEAEFEAIPKAFEIRQQQIEQKND
jgi:hypothetical protein